MTTKKKTAPPPPPPPRAPRPEPPHSLEEALYARGLSLVDAKSCAGMVEYLKTTDDPANVVADQLVAWWRY